jgi:multidrug efflux pump subunit AcrA (membrane-fusion protein)
MQMKKFMLFFILLTVAAGFIFIPSILAVNSPDDLTGKKVSAQAVFTVRTENAETRNLQAYIEVNGDIVSKQQVTVVSDIGGKIVSIKVGLGSTVQKGSLLAEVDPSRPGEVYSMRPVYAPVSGTVISNPAAVGSTVSAGSALLSIAADGAVEVEALIPEREVGQLRTGLQAEVRLEAFPGEVFSAELIRLSPIVDSVSRTKKITLRFVKDDRRINPGMFARIRLNTRTYQNVVSIPQEATVEHRGTPVVFVLDGITLDGMPQVAMREVTLGVTIDGEVEVKSGLETGEVVVVQGQQFLTDGASVRVIGRGSDSK